MLFILALQKNITKQEIQDGLKLIIALAVQQKLLLNLIMQPAMKFIP